MFYLQEALLSEGLLVSGNWRAVEMAEVAKGRSTEVNRLPSPGLSYSSPRNGRQFNSAPRKRINVVPSSGLAGVLFGHSLHGHGTDEVHRLAEVRLEEQVDVGYWCRATGALSRWPRLQKEGAPK